MVLLIIIHDCAKVFADVVLHQTGILNFEQEFIKSKIIIMEKAFIGACSHLCCGNCVQVSCAQFFYVRAQTATATVEFQVRKMCMQRGWNLPAGGRSLHGGTENHNRAFLSCADVVVAETFACAV